MGGRAAAHTRTHIASPRTCRSRTRSASSAACRRKRDPASAATPPTIPVCPTAVRAAVPEPFATSPPRQKDSESNPGRFRQRAVNPLGVRFHPFGIRFDPLRLRLDPLCLRFGTCAIEFYACNTRREKQNGRDHCTDLGKAPQPCLFLSPVQMVRIARFDEGPLLARQP